MSIREVNFVLSDISEISELLPLSVGCLWAVRKAPYSILVLFFAMSAPLKITSMVTAKSGINNMPLFHVLALVEVLLMFAFYCHTLTGRVRVWPVMLLITVNVLDSAFLEDIYRFNAIAWSLNTVVLLGMGLTGFYHLFRSTDVIDLETNPLFVINSGWMIYFAGALFMYVFGFQILSRAANGFFHNAWVIQSCSNIIKNIVVSYGLWLTRYL